MEARNNRKTMDLWIMVCYTKTGLNKAQVVYKVNKLFEVII